MNEVVYPRPSERAVRLLRDEPWTSDQFDQAFGVGAHKQYLNSTTSQPALTSNQPTEAPEGDNQPAEAPAGEGFDLPLIPRAIQHGVRNGVQSVMDLWNEVGDLGPSIRLWGENGLADFDPWYTKAERERDGVKKGGLQLPELPEAQAPETSLGQFSSKMVQFFTGYGITTAATGGLGTLAQAGKAAKFAFEAGKGFVSDFAFMDAEEGNLATLIEEGELFGLDLSNPITGMLDSEGSGFWEGRFKNATEGLFLGAGIEGTIRGVRALRGGRRLRELSAGDKALVSVDDANAFADAVAANDKLAKEVADATGTMTAQQIAEAEAKEIGSAWSVEAVSKRIEDSTLNDMLLDVGKTGDEWAEVRVAGDVGTNTGRVANITSDESFREAINAIDDALKARDPDFGRTITFDEQARITEEIMADTTAASILRDVEGIIPDEKAIGTLKVAQAYLLSSVKELAKLDTQITNMRAKVAGRHGDAVSATYRAQIDVLEKAANDQTAYILALHAPVAEVRAALGRGLGALRTDATAQGTKLIDVMDVLKNTEGDLMGARRQLSIIGQNPTGLKKYAQYVLRHRTWDVVNEWYINSLLSGPVTHAVNFTSNALETVLRPAEYIVGGALHGRADMVREGASRYVGIVSSVLDSVQLAFAALKKGDNILDPLNRTMDAPSGSIHWRGSDGDGAFKTYARKTVNAFGQVIRAPSRLLLTSDEFFKQVNFRASLRGQLVTEGHQMGLTGKALTKHVVERMDTLIDDMAAYRLMQRRGITPKRDMSPILKKALQESREATFTEDLLKGTFGHNLQRTAQETPALRLILPFIRTPSNLISNQFQRMPGVSRLMSRRANNNIRAGGEAAALQHGREFIGGLVMASAAIMAYNGKLTGNLSADPDTRRHMFGAGYLPYSFVFEDEKGNKSFRQFNRMDPRFMNFGLVADFVERLAEFNDPTSRMSGLDIAGAVVSSTARNMLSKSYVKGLSDTLAAIGSGDPAKMQKALAQMSAGAMPFSAFQRQVGGVDPEVHEVRTLVDAAFRQFLEKEGVDRKFNVLGDPIIRPHFDFLGAEVASPFAYSKMKSDSALRAFAILENAFTLPAPKGEWTNGLDLRQYKTESGRSFYDRYQELIGTLKVGDKTLKQRLNEITSSREFARALSVSTPGDAESPAASMLHGVLNAYREIAKRTLEKEVHPDSERYKADKQSRFNERLLNFKQGDDADRINGFLQQLTGGAQ